MPNVKSPLLFLCTFLLLNLHGNAQLPLHELLQSVNEQWETVVIQNPKLKQVHPDIPHEEKIKLHLYWADQILRRKSTAHLTEQQRINRLKSLDVLTAYQKAGIFPQNTNHPNQIIPYFIDKYNTACAVGHLILKSGNKTLPAQIHEENNYGYIKDLVKIYPDINTWASTNGFTVDELAWIQPQYGPCKYNYTFPIVFSDSNYIHPSRCTQAGYSGCSNPYENGYFTIDSNSFPGLTPPLSGRFKLQGFATIFGTYPFTNPNMGFKGGTYDLTIIDANNDTVTQTLTIPTLPVDIMFNVASNDLSLGSSGRIVVKNFAGGTGQYWVTIVRSPYAPNTYLSNNNLLIGDSLVMDSIIIAGKYSIIVQDKNSRCEIADSVYLTGSIGLLDSLSAPIFLDSVRCYTDSGVVIYTAYNTSNNYSITDTFYVPSGHRTISFTDSSNQTSHFGVNHTYPQVPFNVYKTITQPNCSNPNGIVTISAPNATQPVTNTGTFVKTPGNYLTIVTAADGCRRNVTYNIHNVSTTPIQLTSDSILFTCQGQSTSINPTFAGGTPPYAFSPNLLSQGVHTIAVSDSLGCTDSVTIQVLMDTIFYSNTIINPVCQNEKGTVYINASNSLNTFSLNDTLVKPSGNHQYIIIDSLGCQDTLNYSISAPTNSNSYLSSKDSLIKCANVNYNFKPLFGGGSPPHTYTPTSLSLGGQTIIITDSKNCTDSAWIVLKESDLNISITETNPIKCHGEQGICTVKATGTYTPFLGEGVHNIIGDTLYTFAVSDKNGCKIIDSIIFNEPEAISLSNSQIILDQELKGKLNADILGGTPPYQYKIEGHNQTNEWTNLTSNSLLVGKLLIGSYTFANPRR